MSNCLSMINYVLFIFSAYCLYYRLCNIKHYRMTSTPYSCYHSVIIVFAILFVNYFCISEEGGMDHFSESYLCTEA